MLDLEMNQYLKNPEILEVKQYNIYVKKERINWNLVGLKGLRSWACHCHVFCPLLVDFSSKSVHDILMSGWVNKPFKEYAESFNRITNYSIITLENIR